MTRPLVLASTSRYRHELLSRLDLAFVTAAPDFDERAEDHHFAALGADRFALRLGGGKAMSLRAAHPDAWILGADQVAVLPPDSDRPEALLLHKPHTIDAAVDQLMLMSGRVLELVTGVVLLDALTGATHEAIDHQALTLRPYGRPEAEAYVLGHGPLDYAGITLFSRIDGADFTGIIGLPLIAVCSLLRAVGLLPADAPAPGP